jgi:hypothetical protein
MKTLELIKEEKEEKEEKEDKRRKKEEETNNKEEGTAKGHPLANSPPPKRGTSARASSATSASA